MEELIIDNRPVTIIVNRKEYSIDWTRVTQFDMDRVTHLYLEAQKAHEEFNYAQLDSLEWWLTELALRICPALESIGKVNIITYSDGGTCFTGKKLIFHPEELARLVIAVTLSYRRNRVESIKRQLDTQEDLEPKIIKQFEEQVRQGLEDIEGLHKEMKSNELQAVLKGLDISSSLNEEFKKNRRNLPRQEAPLPPRYEEYSYDEEFEEEEDLEPKDEIKQLREEVERLKNQASINTNGQSQDRRTRKRTIR